MPQVEVTALSPLGHGRGWALVSLQGRAWWPRVKGAGLAGHPGLPAPGPRPAPSVGACSRGAVSGESPVRLGQWDLLRPPGKEPQGEADTGARCRRQGCPGPQSEGQASSGGSGKRVSLSGSSPGWGSRAPVRRGGGAQMDDCHCTKRLDSCREIGDRARRGSGAVVQAPSPSPRPAGPLPEG